MDTVCQQSSTKLELRSPEVFSNQTQHFISQVITCHCKSSHIISAVVELYVALLKKCIYTSPQGLFEIVSITISMHDTVALITMHDK